MRFELLLLFVFFLISCGKNVQNESPSIYAEIDTTRATIGDVISFKILGNMPDKLKMSFPELKNYESFEIRQKIQLEEKNGFEFKLVFWDTGKFVIQSLPIHCINADSLVMNTIETEPLIINVHSTLIQT